MRFYDIMLWLFVFNIVLGFMSNYGIYQEYTVQPSTQWTQQVNQSVSTLNASVAQLETADWLSGTWAQISLLFQGLAFVVVTFAYATVLVPWMFMNMGMPSNIAMPLGIGVWFIYGIGLAQIFFGRNIRDME